MKLRLFPPAALQEQTHVSAVLCLCSALQQMIHHWTPLMSIKKLTIESNISIKPLTCWEKCHRIPTSIFKLLHWKVHFRVKVSEVFNSKTSISLSGSLLCCLSVLLSVWSYPRTFEICLWCITQYKFPLSYFKICMTSKTHGVTQKKTWKGPDLKVWNCQFWEGKKTLNTKDVHTFGIGEVVEFLSTVRQKGNFTLQMIELNMWEHVVTDKTMVSYVCKISSVKYQ